MRVSILLFAILMAMQSLADAKPAELKLKLTDDVCNLFPDGTRLRKPGSCKETITCINGESIANSEICTGSKIINLSTMKCYDDTKKSDKYCTVPVCSKNSPKFIQDKKNCNEWHVCNKVKYEKSGSCPNGQIFILTEQSCVYDVGQCDITYDICNIAPPLKYFRDINNCHKYYYCDAKKVLQEEECPIGNYFVARTGECIKKSQADCYQHPLPNEGCGNKKRAIRGKFIDDRASCRGYFYCKDLGKSKDGNFIPDETPNWGQCPMGEFFNEDLQACNDQNFVTCDEDRCDSRNSGKVLSEEPGCQHYLVCENGYTVDEIKCPNNQYFDPYRQVCSDYKRMFSICALSE